MSCEREPQSTTAYERCATVLDDAAGRLRSRCIAPREYIACARDAVLQYLEGDRHEDDLPLLVAYARQPVVECADDPLYGDRNLLSDFDAEIERCIGSGPADAKVGELLRPILAEAAEAAEAAERADGGRVAMVALCARGRIDHPEVFFHRGAIERVLQAAHDLDCVDALVAAVHPTQDEDGQIGHPSLGWGVPRTLVFDLLASLAARRGPSGHPARQALLELASYLETAGPAVVRLPAHLLGQSEREQLHEHLRCYERILGDRQMVDAPWARSLIAAAEGLLWLSADSNQLR